MNGIRFLLTIGALGLKIAGAQSLHDVFEREKMTWYGLDFSQARFVGDFDQVSSETPENASRIRDVYFKSWNAVIVNEKEKYDFSKFYDKDSVIVDLSEVQAVNARVLTDHIMQAAAPVALTRGKLEEVVRRYDPKGRSGLGLVFVVESFDKTAAMASMEREALGRMDVVFFDMASGKILMAKRMQGKAVGFGLRNYWVRSVYEVMKQSKRNWRSWKKEAGAK